MHVLLAAANATQNALAHICLFSPVPPAAHEHNSLPVELERVSLNCMADAWQWAVLYVSISIMHHSAFYKLRDSRLQRAHYSPQAAQQVSCMCWTSIMQASPAPQRSYKLRASQIAKGRISVHKLPQQQRCVCCTSMMLAYPVPTKKPNTPHLWLLMNRCPIA